MSHKPSAPQLGETVPLVLMADVRMLSRGVVQLVLIVAVMFGMGLLDQGPLWAS
jgi:hypothetical protein